MFLLVDADTLAAGYAGQAQSARNHGGMAGRTPARRQDAFGHQHPVHIIGAGLRTYQHNRRASFAQLFRPVGIEHRFAGGSAGRGIQTLRQQATLFRGLLLLLFIETGQQQLIHLTRLNALDSLLLADQTLFHHIDGHFDGCLGVALGRARLEHVEAAFFDGEFQVLHIAVMLFQPPGDFLELLIHFGQVLLQATDFGWSANTRDYVLALRVQQVFTIELLLACTGVTCEGYARTAIVAHISEDHALHVDSRAQIVRNLVEIAIIDGAFVIPG